MLLLYFVVHTKPLRLLMMELRILILLGLVVSLVGGVGASKPFERADDLEEEFVSLYEEGDDVPHEQLDYEIIVGRLGALNRANMRAHETISAEEEQTQPLYNCTTCKNGEACCDGETCCGNGAYCCPAGTGCCGGECCSNVTQSCCPDPKNGGICCEADTTYCCPPLDTMASHCCPRWNVCCKLGRYGCCDPGTGLPIDDLDLFQSPPEEKKQKLKDYSGPTTAYSLFVTADGAFASETITLPSGTRSATNVNRVFNDWEEVQRTFMYNPTQNLFYLLQANFTAPPQPGDEHDIVLWTIDPTTGNVNDAIVQGGVKQQGEVDVSGYAFNPSTGLITMAVRFTTSSKDQGSDAEVGYSFWTLDPSTAMATQVSQYTSKNDSYCGWFYNVSPDGNTVYRLGYEDVFDQENPGIGITDISTSTATTSWVSNPPLPSGVDFYTSLNLYVNNTFLSLASSTFSQDYWVVQWSADSSFTPVVIAKLSDAHNTPFFGPVIEYVTTDQQYYAALVVRNSVLSDLDRWVLAIVELSTGTVTEADLQPYMLAKVTSASALGL